MNGQFSRIGIREKVPNWVCVITVFVFGPLVTNLPIGEYFSSLNNLEYIRGNVLFSTKYYLPGVFGDNLVPDMVNGSLWSLKYEVFAYMLLLAVLLILGEKNKYYFNIPVLLVIIDSFLPHGYIFDFLFDEKSYLALSFALGAFFAVNAEKIKIDLKTVLGFAYILYVFRITEHAEGLLIIVSCIIIIYLSSNKYILRLKPKHDISYGIYVWGYLIQQTVYYYLGYMYVGLHAFIAIVISFLFSWLTFMAIEKPFMRYGKLVFKKYTKIFR